jgi:hypothetical protein
MEIFSALSILLILIGAFYLVKIKIDEGSLLVKVLSRIYTYSNVQTLVN